MFRPRECGCKGIRTCLLCEEKLGAEDVNKINPTLDSSKTVLEYCSHCEKAWEGVDVMSQHPNHSGKSLDFPGVLLVLEFITKEEEEALVTNCDSIPWDLSVSGRRKQNFGPKTNFKKRKINGSSFRGFPKFSKEAQDRLGLYLKDFQTIEQCAIEYRPETGASIDPHIDDCWVWGERVISLSLLSNSWLTMNKFGGPLSKYNLEDYYKGDGILPRPDYETISTAQYPLVRIPMPSRSLLVLTGPARYEWEHSILRSDLSTRRICMAYREFTRDYLPGGKEYESHGKEITAKALNFWDT